MTTHKERSVWLLIAMKGDRLLLKKSFHEGREILQLPGGSSKEEVESLVSELFGERDSNNITDFGTILNTIIKPEETVDLHISLQRVMINNSVDSQFPDGLEWCSREVCISDPRGKRDARLHERLFEDSPLSLKYIEEQLNGWYDAKIVSWDEH
jgi:hypothetical protein